MAETIWKQLDDLLARARQAPYYRDRFPARGPKSWRDWRKLPVTTKEDLRTAYPFGLLAVSRRKLATYHESSGTSGEPTPSFFTDSDWDDVVERFLRNAVSLCDSDTVMVKTPYSLATTAHQMHRAARRRGALVVPADNRSSNMPYRKVVRLIGDLEVTVPWCLPTEPLLWAAAAKLAGMDPTRDFPRLRAFLVAGEPLGDAKRRRIEALWGGVTVFQDYGSTETGSLAGECRHHRMHLWSDRLLAEVQAETGDATPFGRGRLIVTPLYREAMPLVRYRLDDWVELSPSACPCGSELPTVRVLDRASSAMRIQGRTVAPSELEDAIYSLDAAHGVLFWRARFDSDHLEVEIEAESGRAEIAGRELTERLRRDLAISATVREVPRPLVSRQTLSQLSPFLKPRFVFRTGEDWDQAVHY